MINITRCFQNISVFKAVTGITSAEFHALLPDVEAALTVQKHIYKPRRVRQEGGGHDHTRITTREKLLFILFYMKYYATFDVLGWLVDVHHSRSQRWVKGSLPMLEAALGRKAGLPKRKMMSVEEFLRLFPRVKEVFVECSERPIRRSSGNEVQKPFYSGKKKSHRVKNRLVTDACKRILVSGKTCPGRIHDKIAATEDGRFAVVSESVAFCGRSKLIYNPSAA